jgi:hypothetical protein
MRLWLGAALVILLGACDRKTESVDRVRLQRTGGSTFELIPAANQLEHCLVFTVAKKGGLTRQLTMSKKNMSFDCPADKPIGRHAFRVPMTDGEVRVLVLFTSVQVPAGPIAEQLLEMRERPNFNAMDLRLPGNATLEFHEFAPEEDTPAEVGSILGNKDPAGPTAADAGTP